MKRILMLAIVTSAVCLFALGTASPSSDWDLRRIVSNSACIVQKSDSSSIGELLKTHPTRKAACEDARDRHTDDATDKTKCFTYTSGTKDECKKEGVNLND